MKKYLLISTAIAAIFSGSAQATNYTWHDTSGEDILVPGPGGSLTAATSIAVGDIFVGLVDITSASGGPIGGQSLAGIYVAQVDSVTPGLPASVCGGLATCSSFTFGAVGSDSLNAGSTFTSVLNTYLGGITGVNNVSSFITGLTPTVGANTEFAFFSNPSPIGTSSTLANSTSPDTTLKDNYNYLTTGTTEALTLNASSWTATGPTSLAAVAGAAGGLGLGSYSITSTIGYQNSSLLPYSYAPTVNAAGTIFHSEGQFAGSDQTAFAFTTVPEPTLLALLGIGFMGLAASKRRHNA